MSTNLATHLESLRCDDEGAREAAVSALEDCGVPSSGDARLLVDGLSDSCTDVAYWSATLLGRLGADAPAAVDPLAAALADTNRPLAVRERSAWALGQIGPPAREALPQLQTAAASGEVRLARLATVAVGRLSSPT